MLKISDKYRLENNIILTVRKQFVLKLEVLLLREILHFYGVMLEWTGKVRHLGNFIDTTCIDYIDCIINKSYFFGSANKLKENFGK